MNKEEIFALFKSFEDTVCQIDMTECWSARDLQKLLGYSLWQNFVNVIKKAKDACENVGQSVADHFIDVNKKVELGYAKRDHDKASNRPYREDCCGPSGNCMTCKISYK